MVNNNVTYKQKIGDATVRTGFGLWHTICAVIFTGIALFCVFGKAVFEQGEKLAETGQIYTVGKAALNFSQAGSDVKEAFNLYLEGSDEKEDNLSNKENVELDIDEGYSSGSEKKVTA